jgi:hypothetical protein
MGLGGGAVFTVLVLSFGRFLPFFSGISQLIVGFSSFGSFA